MSSFGSVGYAKKDSWVPSKSYFIHNGKEYKDIACYSPMLSIINEGSRITVFHPFPKNAPIDYINWVLNSELFGHNFHTNDANEGIEKGFIIKGQENWRDVFASMIALRYPFELGVNQFLWSYCRARGFSEEESLMISIHFTKDVDNLWLNQSIFNRNHIPFDRSTPITSYKVEAIDYNYYSISSRYLYKIPTELEDVLSKGDDFYGSKKSRLLDEEKLWDDIRNVFDKERELV